MEKKEVKRFWKRLFTQFNVGDTVRIINVFDPTLAESQPKLIDKEGRIIEKGFSYYGDDHVLWADDYDNKGMTRSRSYAVRMKNSDIWHFLDSDLELIS